MRVTGNSPPAGGFGGAAPLDGEIKVVPHPKPSPPVGYILLVLVFILVAAVVGTAWRMVHNYWRLAVHAQGLHDLHELEQVVNAQYQARGELCPTTSMVPERSVPVPADTSPLAFSSDPGWSCLGWRPKTKTISTRLRVERVGTDRVVLTSASDYRRNGPPVHWVIRGAVDEERKTIGFEDVIEEPDQ